MSVRCTSCGDITPAGQLGEAGSEWEGQWFCGRCWAEWDLREGSTSCGSPEGEEKWFSDWRSCSTADEIVPLEDELWEGEDRFPDDVSDVSECIDGIADDPLHYVDWYGADSVEALRLAAVSANGHRFAASWVDSQSDAGTEADMLAQGPASEVCSHRLGAAGSDTTDEACELHEEGALEDAAEHGRQPARLLRRHAVGRVGLLDVMQRLPVAHSFWEHAEPLQGLNGQRSRAVHRLCVVSRGFAKVVSDSSSSLSDPELVIEVIERWRRYELQVVQDIRSFNRRQAACRLAVDPLPIVPFDSESEEDDDN